MARNVAAKEGEKAKQGAAWIRGTTDVFNYICTTPHRCLITPRCREPRLPRNALAVLMPLLVVLSPSSRKSAREPENSTNTKEEISTIGNFVTLDSLLETRLSVIRYDFFTRPVGPFLTHFVTKQNMFTSVIWSKF